MLRLPLSQHPRPLVVPAHIRWEWATYEIANRRAANDYPTQVHRAAQPGCAGGCGLMVSVVGRMCKTCRSER